MDSSWKIKILDSLRINEINAFRGGILKPIILAFIVGALFWVSYLGLRHPERWWRAPEFLDDFSVRFSVPYPREPKWQVTVQMDLLFPSLFSLTMLVTSYLYLSRYNYALLYGIIATSIGPFGVFLTYMSYFSYFPEFVDWLFWSFLIAWPSPILYMFFLPIASVAGVYVRTLVLIRNVLHYIIQHNNKIRISNCARELGINQAEVKEAISLLQERGLAKRKMRKKRWYAARAHLIQHLEK